LLPTRLQVWLAIFVEMFSPSNRLGKLKHH